MYHYNILSILLKYFFNTQAQRRDVERFLDMHMYITTALQRDDMRAVTLNLALDLLYQKACKHDN